MQLVCPNCKNVTEYAGRRPAFCSACGQSLAEANIHEAATVGYATPSPRSGGEFSIAAEPPGLIGGYRVLRPLGQGGMGVVYEAEEQETGRRVAVKLLAAGQAGSPEAMERFMREARLAAAFSHPRSTFVFGAGDHQGQPYIVMELMPGRTLHDVCREEGPLPVHRAVDHILEVIEGLEAAHAAGVIHRDVKPSNCFLDSAGQVKVGDFGLSKSLVSDAALTRTGAFMGTPLFAAPEQVRGGRVDERTDIYSVGATLFFLIANRGPFTGDPAAVIAQIASDPAPSLRGIMRSVPAELDAVIARTLSKNPDHRYATLAQLRRALSPFASGGTSIADVGRRLGAYMLDCAVVAPMAAAVYGSVSIWGGTAPSPDPLGSRYTLVMFLAGLIVWLFQVLYFAIVEGRWGRGVGKLVLGMRVVSADGEPPGFPRALLRAFFIPGCLGFSLAASVVAYEPSSEAAAWSGQNEMQSGMLVGFAAYIPELLCLVTMRKRNGYRGVHEFVSGTRVVRLRNPAEQVAAADLAVVIPNALDTECEPIGPYRPVGVLGRMGSTTVQVGRDDALDRFVWIQRRPPGTVERSTARIHLTRPARPRWLQGGDDSEGRWDAYEAVAGVPLRDAVSRDEPVPWDRARTILLDLADELRESLADHTLPERLSLDQVWVDQFGRVRLLDGRIDPPIRPPSSDAPPTMPSCGDPVQQAWQVLSEAVTLCTTNQMLPGHAHEFVAEFSRRDGSPESFDWAVQTLREIKDRPATLRWDDRLGILGVTAATEYPTYWVTGLLLGMVLAAAALPVRISIGVPLLLDLAIPAVMGFWFRGGPVFRFMNIEVRRRDGRPASRWRCAWRNVVAWVPLIIYNVSVAQLATMEPQRFNQSMDPVLVLVMLFWCAGACLGFLGVVSLIYNLFRPSRGIQDILAGTCLVPR